MLLNLEGVFYLIGIKLDSRKGIRMDSLLNLMTDERWHDSKQLAIELEVEEEILHQVLSFLERYSFIDYNSGRARLKPEFKELLTVDLD